MFSLYFLNHNVLHFWMRKYLFLVLLTVSLLGIVLTNGAFGAMPAGHDCTQCHKITNAEAENALKEIAPEVKVLEIRPIPLKGLWEIAAEGKGQKLLLYMDFSKKYLISGTLIDLKTKANLSQERFNEINKTDVSQIPLDDALIMGEKDAKYRVIVFDDPD